MKALAGPGVFEAGLAHAVADLNRATWLRSNCPVQCAVKHLLGLPVLY
jgi:hypothetical protein